MELIKIETPIMEYMENSLTEEECDKLFSSIQEAVNSDNMVKSIKEADAFELAAGAVVGGAAILYIISSLIKWVKNKYRLTVKKMYDQSKELNDIYTKIEELLKNDKMARFKHRNDVMNHDAKSIVMIDKKDPRKVYKLGIDYIAYDPEYFIKEIDSIMKYVSTESQNKKQDLRNMTDSLLKKIDDNFNANHGFILELDPVIKVYSYKNQRLEDVLVACKNAVSNIYYILYVYNKYTESELQYLQYLQQAYNRMLTVYGKDKDAKGMVDEIFKKLIKNVSLSMDFNAKSVTLLNEVIRYYAEELNKIYDHIRS